MTSIWPAPLLRSAVRDGLDDLVAWFETSLHVMLSSWDATCRETLRTGDSEALHGIRDQCEQLFRYQLDRIDDCLNLIAPHTDAKSEEYRNRLVALRDQLATQYDKLFPRWQTLEDLEGILLEPLTPSREERLELVKRYPPPQAWYDDDTNPFEPEESR